MKVLEAKNLVLGKTYLTTVNHYNGTILYVWKKNNKLVHPHDPEHCWARMVPHGVLNHKESFEIVEQTKMYETRSQQGRYVYIRTESGKTGWMWVDEFEPLYLTDERFELGKLYTATNRTLPKNCIVMQQVVRAKPVNNAEKLTTASWQDWFVLLGYSTDGRWLQVLAGEGHMGWVRNNIEIKPVVSNEA